MTGTGRLFDIDEIGSNCGLFVVTLLSIVGCFMV